ncbi:alpha/beta fold hydrolase [Corynebacterium lubricantis]|uniref:alpha/beta fold hydrolase n=1 Tax=Corynebacterium lubricantis TaxID=541095 RepID=UPI0003639E66|nr:alpha/beta fold hydrolase [Corynebacterium lubricantis]
MRNPAKSIRKRATRSAGGALATALLAVGLIAPAADAQTEAGTSPITWEACPAEVTDASAECGRIDVPRDYADPAGPTISVGFVRNPADNPAARRGSLFVNPGGPGGSVYPMAASPEAYPLPAGISEEWDVIGVQPRGLAGSTQIRCEGIEGSPQDMLDNFVAPTSMFLRACEKSDPGYVRTLTTANTAEDWEMVRRALDLESISILGLSYGTYLGSVYATRHPDRVDRLVLDSAMNPETKWNELVLNQRPAMQRSLYQFFGYAANNNDLYGMGDTPLKVYNTWGKRVLAESGTTPTLLPPQAQVGDLPADVAWAGEAGADAMTALNVPSSQAESLANTTMNGSDGEATSITWQATVQLMAAPSMWHELANHIAGIESLPGTTEAEMNEAYGQYSQEELDAMAISQLNSVAFMYLQTCNENVTPPNYALIPEYVWGTYVMKNGRIPYNLGYGAGVTCNGYAPVTGVQPLDGSQLETRPLQISGTDDAQTIYSERHYMANKMGAHVLTVHGPGHGHVAAGNPVVDDIVVNYLRTGDTGPSDAPGYWSSQRG